MGLQRLAQVQTGQALHIKAGQPHGADEHDPEQIGGILELLIQLPLFHLHPVALDIQPSFLEGLHFVLLLMEKDAAGCRVSNHECL